MIKNIIFDFGDVFINLDKDATIRAMKPFGLDSISDEMIQTNKLYETGKINSESFIQYYHSIFPKASRHQLINAWNAIILDFPQRRFQFIKELSKSGQYRLFLLSNTNELHIHKVKEEMGEQTYEDFKKMFSQFYLSHEIFLRKPNRDIYEYVLESNNINVFETLFVDDTEENTRAAQILGLHVWNINPVKEDVINLFDLDYFDKKN